MLICIHTRSLAFLSRLLICIWSRSWICFAMLLLWLLLFGHPDLHTHSLPTVSFSVAHLHMELLFDFFFAFSYFLLFLHLLFLWLFALVLGLFLSISILVSPPLWSPLKFSNFPYLPPFFISVFMPCFTSSLSSLAVFIFIYQRTTFYFFVASSPFSLRLL